MEGDTVSLEENKAIVRRSIEVINSHDLSLVDDLVATDYVDHTRHTHGAESLKQFLTMIFKSFPDFHLTIEDTIAEGDKVWVRLTITATHIGEFAGLPPTSNKFTEPSVWIYRIIDGKIVEGWDVQDELDFYRKIDAREYTEKVKTLSPEE